MARPRSSRTVIGRRRRRLLCLGAVVLVMALALVEAPRYLVFENGPIRSDAVIMISGPDMESREREARRLVKDGFARYILVPHQGLVMRFRPGASMNAEPDQIRKVVFDLWEGKGGAGNEKGLAGFENTHLEVLSALGMMSRLNLRSAIIVTYPYHLRRVKILTDRVFPRKAYRLSFVFPPSIKVKGGCWLFRFHDIRWVLREYIKIAYFFIYSHLPSLSG